MKHPEELLAPFVDGTASVHERATVETHLMFCPSCRAAVELARSARAALRSLPELEAPSIDLRAMGLGTGVERAARAETPPAAAEAPTTAAEAPTAPVEAPTAPVPPFGPPAAPLPSSVEPLAPEAGRAGPHGPGVPAPLARGAAAHRRRAPRTPSHWPARTARAAVAVAAVAIGVAVVAGLTRNGGQSEAPMSGGRLQAPRPASPTSGPAAFPTGAQAYTAKSFASLAGQLAQEARTDRSSTSGLALSPVPTPTPGSSTTEVAISCMDRATGLVAGTQLFFLQAAVYEGQPAYIGAFLSGTGKRSTLVVLAVSVQDCLPLSVIHQSV